MILELIQDFSTTLAEMPADRPGGTDRKGLLTGIRDLLTQRTQLIGRYPWIVSQEIVNYLDRFVPSAISGPVQRKERRRFHDGLEVIGKVLRSVGPPGHQSRITALNCSSNGRCFLSGSADGSIGYWEANLETPIWLLSTHKGPVTWVALSRDGCQAISAGDDGTVCLWDLEQGSFKQLFANRLDARGSNWWPYASACGFFDDGTLLVTRAGSCRRMDPDSGRELWRNSEIVGGLSKFDEDQIQFCPSQNLLVIGDKYGKIRICDTVSGIVTQVLEPGGNISHLAVSPDGKILLAATSQGRLWATELPGGSPLGAISISQPLAMCPSPSQREFFVSDAYGILHKIHADGQLHEETLNPWKIAEGLDSSVLALKCMPDGDTLVLGTESGSLFTWSWSQGKLLKKWPHGGNLLKGDIFPDGAEAIGISGAKVAGQINKGSAIHFFPRSGKGKMVKSPHSAGISGVAVLGARLALTVDSGGTAVVWRKGKVLRVHRFEGVALMSCAGCAGSSLGVCGTQDDDAIVLGAGPTTRVFGMPSNSYPQRPGISALAANKGAQTLFAVFSSGEVRFSAEKKGWRRNPGSLMATAAAIDGRCQWAASGNVNGDVLLWQCTDGEQKARLTLHQGEVTAMVFGEEGGILYTAGADSLLYALDVSRQYVLYATSLPAPAIALSANGNWQLNVLDSEGSIYQFAIGSVPGNQHPMAKWLPGIRTILSRIYPFSTGPQI